MQEKKLSQEESLALITEMIHTAKNSFVDTGVGPILWGSVIALCSLLQVAEIHYNLKYPFDIWLLAMIAIIPQIIISIRERKMQKARGWTDQTVTLVWMCFGIGVFMINFISSSYVDKIVPVLREYSQLTGKPVGSLHFWNYATAYLLFLYGVPTIITAATRKFRIMLLGGILCWICSIVSVFTNIKIDFLLMALCAMASWLVPGILIRQAFLKKVKLKNV
jgi:hypothetical protein